MREPDASDSTIAPPESRAVAKLPKGRAPSFVASLALAYSHRALPRVARIACGHPPRKGAEKPTLPEQIAAFREITRVAFHGASVVERSEVRERVEKTTEAITDWGRARNIDVAAMQDLLGRLAYVWR